MKCYHIQLFASLFLAANLSARNVTVNVADESVVLGGYSWEPFSCPNDDSLEWVNGLGASNQGDSMMLDFTGKHPNVLASCLYLLHFLQVQLSRFEWTH
jgi:hypothetical protein